MQKQQHYEVPQKSLLYDQSLATKIPVPGSTTSGIATKEKRERGQISTAESEAIIQPDFLSKLNLANSFGRLENPTVAQYITEQEFRRIVLNTGSRVSGSEEVLLRNVDYQDAIAGGLLSRMFLWLRGFRLHETHDVNQDIKIPVAELHCPNIDGCTATYTERNTEAEQWSMRLEVVGNGIGTTCYQGLTITDRVTSDGECLTLYKRAKVALQEWRNTRDGDVLIFVKILSLMKGLSSEPIDTSAYHLCGNDYHETTELIEDLRNRGIYSENDLTKSDIVSPRTTQSFEMKIKKGVMLNGTVSLPEPLVSVIGTNASLSVKSEVIREIEFSGSLRGGHSYVGFYISPDRSNVNWTWCPIC